jgi:GntR family transcriptional regulator
MLFQIDSNVATPVYRQLVDQVQHGAASGALKPRDPLPGIRPLARQLRLNRNTVAKAYGELENLGVIKVIPGKGCFVEAVENSITPKNRREVLAAKIDAALIAAHQLQLEAPEFLELVKERIAALGANIRKFSPIFANKPNKAQIPARNEPAPESTIVEPEGWTPATD